MQVDVGLSEELLDKYAELQEAVLPRWRRALDDVHSGLDVMMGLGGALACFFLLFLVFLGFLGFF